MRSSLYTLAGSAATALASVRGFNYASQSQTYETFVSQFNTAAGLVGADDFTSARLYTMIQDGTANTVISAIPAAIATNTTLLIGLWASENQDAFNNELTALKNAISQYGSQFADLVVGISVGSEDLYRNSPTGIAANSGYGQEPDVIVDYIGQVRKLIQGTTLGSKPVGHVDTWNDFVNGSNSAVVAASDFLGLDEYPFYQTTDDNDVQNGGDLFFEAYDKVNAVAGGKPIWITETGWPVSGDNSGKAVASTDNAEIYWQQVACELQSRNIDFWWYILADSGASPSFGVTETLGQETPLYNLACKNAKSSSSSASSSKTSVSSVAQASTPSSTAAATTVSKPNPVPSAGFASGTGAVASGNATEPTVYVTDVIKTTVTTCPVGQTLTVGGSTTVLATPSVFTTTYSTQSTVSTVVPVSSALVGAVGSGAVPSGTGVAPVGTAGATGGAMGGAGGASTLASSWAAGQTPSATSPGAPGSTYAGAASKVDGSMAALALGAVAAVFAL
ncbi:hypothetical protein AAFC00_003799 [Neodothiora populina]|uniref:Probable glucan endo-1,3-beta-glucosidase eglC n=1 Tax=Neodothiora populina TaxID=2781224 RepID=A0ABR3PFE7_9PEZI